MSYCFILASSEDRAHLLDRCISCFDKNQFYSNADIYLYWQGDENQIPRKSRFKDIIISDRLRGIFLPRYELFKACSEYDYVILIDDDLFLKPDTFYGNSMSFLANIVNNKGICSLGRHTDKVKNTIEMIDYSKDKFNILGGTVFPKECVKLIVDYFKGTNESVTEDIFWVLLYIKGYDLFRDFTSCSIHIPGRKTKKAS